MVVNFESTSNLNDFAVLYLNTVLFIHKKIAETLTHSIDVKNKTNMKRGPCLFFPEKKVKHFDITHDELIKLIDQVVLVQCQLLEYMTLKVSIFEFYKTMQELKDKFEFILQTPSIVKALKNAEGLQVINTSYDRLIEVTSEPVCLAF